MSAEGELPEAYQESLLFIHPKVPLEYGVRMKRVLFLSAHFDPNISINLILIRCVPEWINSLCPSRYLLVYELALIINPI